MGGVFSPSLPPGCTSVEISVSFWTTGLGFGIVGKEDCDEEQEAEDPGGTSEVVELESEGDVTLPIWAFEEELDEELDV